jgi:NADH dehydrogenase FAD-containing subunit
LIVDQHLRSVAAPEVHGAGDCIAFHGRPLPRVGVYAIRQAPVLFHNLMAAAEGTPPEAFRPQRRYLIIMNLGDETGLAVRGRWYWHGKAAFWLKDWIDRRFLRTYQDAARTGQFQP